MERQGHGPGESLEIGRKRAELRGGGGAELMRGARGEKQQGRLSECGFMAAMCRAALARR